MSLERAAEAVAAVIRALDLEETPDRVRGIVAMNAFAWRPAGPAYRGMLALMGNRFIRELDVLTGFLPRIASTWFGAGRHLDQFSRGVFRLGMGKRGRRAFHDYLRDARRCHALYARIERALAGPLADLPLLTIFGERNDPFGFQKRWKTLFPDARQVVVANGNHFPMCDAPDFVARTIHNWHRRCVAR